MRRTKLAPWLLGSLALLGACAKEEIPQGAERGTCFPNGTCFTGLVCLSGVCVLPPADGAVATADSRPSSPDGGAADHGTTRDRGTLPRDSAPRADAFVPPKTTDPCTPGVKMWCEGLAFSGWGQVTCGTDGKWATKLVNGKTAFDCRETSDGRRPTGRCACYHFYFNAMCCEQPSCFVPAGSSGQLCPASPGKLCDYCNPTKPECSETGGRCIVTNSYETFCGRACSKANPQTNPCPTGYTCMTVKVTGTSVDQCIPDDLSCYR